MAENLIFCKDFKKHDTRKHYSETWNSQGMICFRLRGREELKGKFEKGKYCKCR